MFFRRTVVDLAHEEGDREEDNDTDDKETERNRCRISEFTKFFSNIIHGSFLFC